MKNVATPESTVRTIAAAEGPKKKAFFVHRVSIVSRVLSTPPGATPVAWSRLNGVLYDAKRHEHPIVRGSGLVSSAEESAPGG